MRAPKINLLNPGSDERRRRHFSFWKGAALTVAALVVLVPALFSFASARLIRAVAGLNPEAAAVEEKVSVFEQVRRLVGTSEKRLRGEERDRINILLLGEGGEGHDGPHLTDTILFVTFQPSTSKVGILSLPRDLWIPYPDGTKGKINNANAAAEKRRAGSGGAYAAKTVSELLRQPVDYYVRVDFSAFKTLIDDVGGVTVNVERSFTDFAYPTDDDLYQTVRFEKGWQTMDGETALQYVRSRHGNNNEGSDFARSRRQQKVILALKEKIVSFDTLLNPSRVASILETLRSHVITDMELWEIVKLAKALRGIDPSTMAHLVLDDDPEGPLYATTIPLSDGDAYVLLPRRGDWTDIQAIAREVLSPRKPVAAPAAEPAERVTRVEVRNGTRQPGLAKKTGDLIAKVGYEVVRVGNSAEQDRDRTVVYDLTDGAFPKQLETLRSLLNAEVGLTLPGYLASGLTPSDLALTNEGKASSDVDFLVVVGKSSLN